MLFIKKERDRRLIPIPYGCSLIQSNYAPVMMERIEESLYSVDVTAVDTIFVAPSSIPLSFVSIAGVIRPCDDVVTSLYVVSVNLAFEGTDLAIVNALFLTVICPEVSCVTPLII